MPVEWTIIRAVSSDCFHTKVNFPTADKILYYFSRKAGLGNQERVKKLGLESNLRPLERSFQLNNYNNSRSKKGFESKGVGHTRSRKIRLE